MSPREVAPVEASPLLTESVRSRDADNSLLEADGDYICLQRENSSAQSQNGGRASADAEVSAGLNVEPSAAVRERPILFSAPMVRALLAGTKTQTRRVVKPQPPKEQDFRGSLFGLRRAVADGVKMYSLNDYDRLAKHQADWELHGSVGVARDAGFPTRYRCPYGGPGDLLWVRETWAPNEGSVGGVLYRADHGECQTFARADIGAGLWTHRTDRWRPSIHMPRWTSRITLRITDVRVERLNDCSEEDATAEGTQEPSLVPILGAFWSSRDGYARLWEHINGAGSWAANPWVWAVSFERVGPAESRLGDARRTPADESPGPNPNLLNSLLPEQGD